MQNGSRHTVILSNPRVADREMLFSACIEDWDKCRCFFYPLDKIDNKSLYIHVMWKFSGDSDIILTCSVELDIEQTDPNKLNLRNWDFA